MLLDADCTSSCTHNCSLLPLQLFQELFWLAPNVYMLIVPCGWFDRFVGYCMALRWSCLNLVSRLVDEQDVRCQDASLLMHARSMSCFAESCVEQYTAVGLTRVCLHRSSWSLSLRATTQTHGLTRMVR